ncbi:unnamed protein product [Linum trigynum]|uniref:Uncharacterized protein n=1 Tax=Linum trigynum TaxID=586398 RepID=A0AAV2D861_9ROSI
MSFFVWADYCLECSYPSSLSIIMPIAFTASNDSGERAGTRIADVDCRVFPAFVDCNECPHFSMSAIRIPVPSPLPLDAARQRLWFSFHIRRLTALHSSSEWFPVFE